MVPPHLPSYHINFLMASHTNVLCILLLKPLPLSPLYCTTNTPPLLYCLLFVTVLLAISLSLLLAACSFLLVADLFGSRRVEFFSVLVLCGFFLAGSLTGSSVLVSVVIDNS